MALCYEFWALNEEKNKNQRNEIAKVEIFWD